MNRMIFTIFSWVTVIVLLLLVVTLVFWEVYPYQPIKFNVLPFNVEEKTIKVGGVIIYDLNFCKYNALIPTAYKSFEDGIIFTLPSTIVTPKKVGCGFDRVQFDVPDTLPPDTYTLNITYRYQVNPIRTVDVSIKSVPFIVTK